MNRGTPALHLGEGFELPVEAVTETFAIIANRGGGKSSTGRVLAEELSRAGQMVIVLDPKGDWHGIRTSADGAHEGLPFAILGGDHGDLPLHEDAGALVADTLVRARASAVLDLSALSKTKARTFATAFAERLYRANRGEPVHVIVDEADILIPQRAAADTMRLLGAMEDLAKRGRHRGIGMTAITQRGADVSKTVLDLMETLIVLRVTGPKTRRAVMDWVDDHADDREQMRRLEASLKTLTVGHGWVWSPGWLGDLRQVAIRPITTLDTHATPRPGVAPTVATTKAAVDIDALGEQMTQLRDQAEQNDPAALRRRIRELETIIATSSTRSPAVQVERVEVPTPTPVSDSGALARLTRLRAELTQAVAGLDEAIERLEGLPTAEQLSSRHLPTAPHRVAPSSQTDPASAEGRSPAVAKTGPAPRTESLPKAQRLVLEVLATYGPRDITTTAILAGYSSTGGGYRNAVSRLRVLGLVTGHATLEITRAGREALGPVSPLPQGDTLREHWKQHHSLSAAHRAILDALAETYPDPLNLTALAERTGYAAAGGGYRNAVSRLRSLGLISGRSDLLLNPDLVG